MAPLVVLTSVLMGEVAQWFVPVGGERWVGWHWRLAPHPSQDVGPILCFAIPSGYCMISKTQIQYVYGDTLPIQTLMLTLIPHVLIRPSTFPSLSRRFPFLSASSHQFPLYPLEPSFCFSIRFLSPHRCFIPPPPLSAPPTLYLIASVKPFFFSHFDLFCASLSPLLSFFPFSDLHIHLIHRSLRLLTGAVMGWCQHSSVSADDCQLGQDADSFHALVYSFAHAPVSFLWYPCMSCNPTNYQHIL